MDEPIPANTQEKKPGLPLKGRVVFIILLFVLIGFILVVKLFFSGRPDYSYSGLSDERAIIAEIERLLSQWDKTAAWTQALFVFVSVAAITASIYVAAFTGDTNHKNTVKISSFVAALFSPC